MYCRKRSWKLQNLQVKKVTRRCGVQWGHDRGQSEVTTRGVEGGPVMVSVRNYMYSWPHSHQNFYNHSTPSSNQILKQIDLRLSINLRKLSDNRARHSVLSKFFKGGSMGEWKTHYWVLGLSIAFYFVQVPKLFFHTPH